MKTLYYSLIHSHLSYGTMLWGSAFQYRLRQLEVIQKKSVRNICKGGPCNVGYNAHTSPLFKQLSIPKLNDIYNTQLCKLMFLFTNGTLPCPLQMVFTRNSNVHSYQTRQAHDPHFVARKSSFISKFFMYQVPVAWSNLPLATKSCKTVKSFNYQVKKYYINTRCGYILEAYRSKCNELGNGCVWGQYHTTMNKHNP